MNLEQQVCSLNLAKHLKELGVKQESYFFWVSRHYRRAVTGSNPRVGIIVGTDINRAAGGEVVDDEFLASAFTVAELGEILLRSEIDGNKPIHGFRCFLDYKGKMVFGWDRRIDFSADTEADARAKMLIYLLENKLITL